jgi:hypothetical protein
MTETTASDPRRGATDHRTPPRQTEPADQQATAATPASGPDTGNVLLQLLRRFKDARRRRDAADYGSRDWTAADVEIQTLQHEIFDRAYHEPRLRDDVGRVPLGPDDELGQPERTSAD